MPTLMQLWNMLKKLDSASMQQQQHPVGHNNSTPEVYIRGAQDPK